MKIEKIISNKDFRLVLKFDSGEVKAIDYSGEAQSWRTSRSKAYRMLAVPANFLSATIEGGDIVFPKVKVSGKTAYLDANSIYQDATKHNGSRRRVSKASNSAPATSSTLGTISAIDVMNHTTLHGLNFTGEWKDFLGEPEKNFYMILSAQPGHGKSTFCLKFANYLAKNFGRSVFITNEEHEALIKRKLQFIEDSLSPDFDICFEAPDYSRIRQLLSDSQYDFVFIDSSQASGMDAKELWQLKQQFPDKALIVISRMTKDGKTRGSQNKEYDGDITINFTAPGIARTIKNRFYEVGKEFVLF